MLLGKLIFIAVIVTFATLAYGQERAGAPQGMLETLSRKLEGQLSGKFSGARIELTSPIHWTAGAPAGAVQSVTLIDENARGEAQFSARSLSAEGGEEIARGWASFAAYVPAKVAVRRILPGETLKDDFFSKQEINVASGQARELRGLILPQSADVSGLETRQTVLEGQFLMSSAVERIPDVRRGDAIRIRLISGTLTLSAGGIAEEPAYLNGRIRVMANKTKRELVGLLLPGGVVEVKL